jgi:hypothetical protein
MTKPNETRNARVWSPREVDEIRAGIDELPWLNVYADTEVEVSTKRNRK